MWNPAESSGAAIPVPQQTSRVSSPASSLNKNEGECTGGAEGGNNYFMQLHGYLRKASAKRFNVVLQISHQITAYATNFRALLAEFWKTG